MEAFSYQNSTNLLNSVFLPNTPITLSGLLEGGGEMINSTSSFSYYPPEPPQEIPFDVRIEESSCVYNSTKSPSSDYEPSLTDKHKADFSSMVVEPLSQKDFPLEKKRKNRDGSCLSSAKSQAKTAKKCSGRKEKEEKKKKSRANKKQKSKVPEEPVSNYIHVRARRGEATDSHSLAERVRREKISVRMKLLQGLVPGCDKVIGKTHMLDEIINYVQSLQYQVELLSMKLASVNPMSCEFAANLDAFMVKSEKLRTLVSPLSSMPQSSPTQPIDLADTATTLTTRNNFSLLDNSVSFLYQQEQRTNTFSQDNENLLWDVDDQRQYFISQCGFNNLCAFH